MASHKLARYFGIEVEILDEVEPRLITALKHKAEQLFNTVGFSPEDFFLYVHNIKVIPNADRDYWAWNIPVEKRIRSFLARFRVNPKQERHERIKFYGAYTSNGDDASERNIDITSGTSVEWSYPGVYLVNGTVFKTHLITFVSKSLRRQEFRKIKVQIAVSPTEDFKKYLKEERCSAPTQFDVPLLHTSEVNFILKSLTEEDRRRIFEEVRATERKHEEKFLKQQQIITDMNQRESKKEQPSLSIGGNVNSITIVSDSSNFTVSQRVEGGMTLGDVYEKMLKIAETGVQGESERKEVSTAIAAMARSRDKSEFTETYKRFVSAARDSLALFKDFVPLLTQVL